ncbi:MAG: hypothetical protein E7626_05865 [Ruminococcaceae bacterium]|nr:hypothetical protein [Oscillospiraceae bacterium]
MEKGYVITEVRSRGEALPIAGATVTVSGYEGGVFRVLGVQITDSSGSTLPLEVDTPDRSETLFPNPPEQPFATISIEIDKQGFLTQIFAEVPVFAGITTIQPVQLIPYVGNAPTNVSAPDTEIGGEI